MQKSLKLIQSTIACVLTAYMLGFSAFNSLHHHLEMCQASVQEEENDPCHLRIYHHAESSDGGCSHGTHVHAKAESCSWCKQEHTLQLFFASSLPSLSLVFHHSHEEGCPENPVLNSISTLAVRGPPVQLS